MNSSLPLVHRSHRVLPFFLNFPCMAEGGWGSGGPKLEINIPSQQIYAISKGGAYNRRRRNVE